MAALAAVALALAGSLIPAQPSSAYTYNGCKWSTPNLTIGKSNVPTGTYRSTFESAAYQWTLQSDANLSHSTSTGPSWQARTGAYGNTGWNGETATTCPFGNTLSINMRLNTSAVGSSLPFNRIRLVWLHEIGHGLGLDHVSSTTRVMYGGGTTVVYNNGVYNLTSDEINGVNSLY